MKLRDKTDYALNIISRNKVRLITMSMLFVIIFAITIVLLSVPVTIAKGGENLCVNYNNSLDEQRVYIEPKSYKEQTEAFPIDLFDAINEYSYNKYTMPNNEQRARFDLGNLNADLVVSIGDFKSIKKNTKMLEGSVLPIKSDVTSNSVWISTSIYQYINNLDSIPNIAIGDSLTLPIELGNGVQYLTMQLKGVLDSQEPILHISQGLALKQNITKEVSYVCPKISGTYANIVSDYNKIMKPYKQFIEQNDEYIVTNSITTLQKELKTPIFVAIGIFVPIAIILIIIACLTLANTIDIIVNKNKYFFAMNRAIGINNRQLIVILMMVACAVLIIVTPIAYGLSYAGYSIIDSLSHSIGNISYFLFLGHANLMSPVISPLIALGVLAVTALLSLIAIALKLVRFNDKRLLSILTQAK